MATLKNSVRVAHASTRTRSIESSRRLMSAGYSRSISVCSRHACGRSLNNDARQLRTKDTGKCSVFVYLNEISRDEVSNSSRLLRSTGNSFDAECTNHVPCFIPADATSACRSACSRARALFRAVAAMWPADQTTLGTITRSRMIDTLSLESRLRASARTSACNRHRALMFASGVEFDVGFACVRRTCPTVELSADVTAFGHNLTSASTRTQAADPAS
mmetsp:Transcript_19166/g.62928  ORF Transcript_19166/g.62928 Transcript_19166/m.62928 type:complete len:218 (+) Transcript_19166:606-1259(+)